MHRFAITVCLIVGMAVAVAFAQDAQQGNEGLSPKVQAWTILDSALANSSYEKRAKAAQVLGLDQYERSRKPSGLRSRHWVTTGLKWRAFRESVRPRRYRQYERYPGTATRCLQDTDVQVILARRGRCSTWATNLSHAVYYAILTGETKTGTGLLARA